jgi:UDP-N-acetylglucosamine:LPS N-acetylglucosamine transferase
MKHSALEKRRLIQFLVLRGGGGHYSTYTALRSAIEQQQLPWELGVTFIDEIGKPATGQNKTLDFYRLLGVSSDKFYDFIQKNGLAWIHLLTIHLHKLLTRLKHAVDVRLLEQEWNQHQPDLVVSVVPFHNQAIWDSIQRAKPDTPIVTILTDFADCPPAYWIEPKTRNYLVCGTEKAVQQALSQRVETNRIIQTSGLVIHPRFYQPMAADRRIERQRLGLDPDRLTGLVLFGANGSQAMLEIAKRLEQLADCLQLIFLCGRNQAVASVLRETASRQKRVVVAFTEDIPDYMHLADFLIGKPGNVSISEAIAMKLPVIVERNGFTLPQERYAADWIREKEVGLTIPSFRHIQKAVEIFLEPETFAGYRSNVTEIDNQAVFEMPAVLNQILAVHHQSVASNSTRTIELMEQQV